MVISRRWSVTQRLEFIENILFWEGRINRSHLMRLFNISAPQASSDLKEYQRVAPGNTSYNARARAYVASDSFSPKFGEISAHHYLAQLRLIADGVVQKDDTFLDRLPPFTALPFVARRVDSKKLRDALAAMRDRRSIRVCYQSLSRPEPTWRWISPHSLAFNGMRWHLRAWCHLREQFRDFLLARICEVGETDLLAQDASTDMEWHTKVVFQVGPHPDLTEAGRKAIELDYGMIDGVLEIETRVALSYYLERNLNLDVDITRAKPERLQIVWLNRDAVELARKRACDLVKRVKEGGE